jgi:hypothetical protein
MGEGGLVSGVLQESQRDMERRDGRVCCLMGVMISRVDCRDEAERAGRAGDARDGEQAGDARDEGRRLDSCCGARVAGQGLDVRPRASGPVRRWFGGSHGPGGLGVAQCVAFVPVAYHWLGSSIGVQLASTHVRASSLLR